MKLILVLIGIIGALLVVMAIVGAWLPRAHVATRTARFRKTPAEIYSVVRDFAAAPAWRPELKAVELLPSVDGHAWFREVSRHGPVTYRVLEERVGETLVTEITDLALPFGGTWTFEFVPAASGTQLRITERGEVRNVIFRFLARFVFGYTGTIETYLRDLDRKMGDEITPQP